jgi:hypothetical protein
MKRFIVIIVMLLASCSSPPPIVTLKDARSRFEQSLAEYQACIKYANGYDYTCKSEELAMNASMKAYTDAMSSGLRENVVEQGR